MKADECVCDVVGAFRIEDQSCRCIQNRLESAHQVARNTHQHAVAVVLPGMHQGNYQLLECGGRYISADLTQLTKSGKATRHRFLDMHPHRQVSVYVDAEIADGLHWSDVDAVNQHSRGWKLMLAPACRAPQNLGFVRIKLQPI